MVYMKRIFSLKVMVSAPLSPPALLSISREPKLQSLFLWRGDFGPQSIGILYLTKVYFTCTKSHKQRLDHLGRFLLHEDQDRLVVSSSLKQLLLPRLEKGKKEMSNFKLC